MRRLVAAAAFVALGGCASPPPTPIRLHVASPVGTSAFAWDYAVRSDLGAGLVHVTATFATTPTDELVIEEGAAPFVKALVVDGAPITEKDGSFYAKSCAMRGCHLTYDFDLAGAAKALDSEDDARAFDGGFLASPPAFLVHPARMREGERYRVRGDDRFHTGIFPAGENVYVAAVDDLEGAPYSAFGDFDADRLDVTGGTIELRTPKSGAPGVGRGRLAQFVRDAGEAVASYLGRFPVSRVLVVVVPVPGDHIEFGKTMGGGGASIVLFVGRDTTTRKLADDWVTVHELTHLAVPSMPRQNGWFTEGVATYVEPYERVAAGTKTEAATLRELVAGLPQGEPLPTDRGLDHTHTWGRTYWGGALFCLLGELRIRSATDGKKGLKDALRAVVAQGGSIAVSWSMEKTLGIADAAIGTPVLRPLYDEQKDHGVSVDLAALFADLGVRPDGTIDERAPHAAWAHGLFHLRGADAHEISLNARVDYLREAAFSGRDRENR